jgi:hypothetical protein
LTKDPIFIKKDIGVRSLHFRNSVLSIGTGIGTVLFYDLRAHKFLHDNTDNHLKLQTTGGWIVSTLFVLVIKTMPIFKQTLRDLTNQINIF